MRKRKEAYHELHDLEGEEEVENGPVWREMYVCPFCDFKTRIEDIFIRHLRIHLLEEARKKERGFNPSAR